MSRHTLTFTFEFQAQDPSDPESQSGCDILDIRVDHHTLAALPLNDRMVRDMLSQSVMRIHNMQQRERQ